MTIKERFDQFEDEFLKFERVENKLNNRPDLHAFILLDKIISEDDETVDDDIVACAEHDEIWLSASPDKLESVSDEIIRDLVRCGVRYDEDVESLAMFV